MVPLFYTLLVFSFPETWWLEVILWHPKLHQLAVIAGSRIPKILNKKKKSAHKTHKVVPCIYYPSEMNNRRGKMLCSQSHAHSNKHVRHSRLDAVFIVKDWNISLFVQRPGGNGAAVESCPSVMGTLRPREWLTASPCQRTVDTCAAALLGGDDGWSRQIFCPVRFTFPFT